MKLNKHKHKMKKYRFIGDSSDWEWDVNPKHGEVYTLPQLNEMRNGDILTEEDMGDHWSKKHWEVVNTKLHKDTDLGYFAGLAMQALINSNGVDPDEVTEIAIEYAKELIKQLDNEKI